MGLGRKTFTRIHQIHPADFVAGVDSSRTPTAIFARFAVAGVNCEALTRLATRPAKPLPSVAGVADHSPLGPVAPGDR